MRKSTVLFLSAAAALVVLAGCQTVKPTAQESMIRVDTRGFARGAGTGHATIAFAASFGNADLVKTWDNPDSPAGRHGQDVHG